MLLDEVIDAVVVQADGVEHAGRRLNGARRRVTGARGLCHRLGDDAAELGEIHGAGHFARTIAAIRAFIDEHNDDPRPFVWTAKAEDILDKVRRARAVLDKIASE